MYKSDYWRLWAIRWLYLIALAHFIVGVVMTWFGDSILFSIYNQSMLGNFTLADNQAADRLQIWWLAIFGATLQAFSILLMALIYVGKQYKNHQIWLLIIIALLIWAPQDIYFSAIKNMWMNVWVDLTAVATLCPPLVFLWRCDSTKDILQK